MSRVLNWVAERHWWFIGLLAFLLFHDVILGTWPSVLETNYLVKYFIFLILLVIIGALLDSILRLLRDRTKFVELNRYKHKLHLEFSTYHDWDVLVTHLAQFPGTVAEVKETDFYVFDFYTDQFDLAAKWPKGGENFRFVENLQNNFHTRLHNPPTFFQWDGEHMVNETSSKDQIYCLPIQHRKNLIGIMLFQLKAGEVLTSDQDYIFKNIGDELACVLAAGQEHRKFHEMATSETALAERRKVSRYLHDGLGHNLGYLHFKLDELVRMKAEILPQEVAKDLHPMYEASQESIKILRDILETINPETTPVLTNLLSEYAQKISRRADFKIILETKGKPVPLLPDVNQAIFYVFEEALSNTEKYARASQVHVLTEWKDGVIELTISDDGVGFSLEDVNTDRHFGLEILRERMDKVHGEITLTSSKNSGTTVFVRVPTRRFIRNE